MGRTLGVERPRRGRVCAGFRRERRAFESTRMGGAGGGCSQLPTVLLESVKSLVR